MNRRLKLMKKQINRRWTPMDADKGKGNSGFGSDIPDDCPSLQPSRTYRRPSASIGGSIAFLDSRSSP
jgi:hypothetical protein